MAEVTSSKNRSLLRVAVSDLSRLAKITNVIVRHGFSTGAVRGGILQHDDAPAEDGGSGRDPADAAARFRTMLEELGPTFVKVGQILSTRPDVLPPPFVSELAKLQDDAPPVPFEQIRGVVEDALEQPVDALFAEFEPTPLASASMAQAHLARLHDGTRVVVKVQRPNISDTMRADLDLMHVFARLLEVTIADMELYAPGDIVAALDEALSYELDFLHEATNLERFARTLADVPDVRVPTLFRSHTARTVLTMEFIDGRRISDLEPGSPEAERQAMRLIDAFFGMVFEDGNFHADPHPGNLIVDRSGKLAFIDFGLCGYLSTTQRDQIIALVIAVLAGDVDGIARVLVRMGQPLEQVPMGAFKAEVAAIRERYLRSNLAEIDASAFIEECIDAAQRYRIRIATDYSLLSKAAVTIEGVVRGIAPELDLLSHVGPYQRRLLERQYAPERLMKGAVASALHMGAFLREVPDQLEQVLMDLESGRLQVRVNADGANAVASALNRQATRIFMALVCAALIVATPLFLANEPVWLWGKVPLLTTFCALSASGFAFWGLAWHVIGGRERDWRLRMTPLLRFLRRRG